MNAAVAVAVDRATPEHVDLLRDCVEVDGAGFIAGRPPWAGRRHRAVAVVHPDFSVVAMVEVSVVRVALIDRFTNTCDIILRKLSKMGSGGGGFGVRSGESVAVREIEECNQRRKLFCGSLPSGGSHLHTTKAHTA
jgi:D-serine deaminase-like pyridoxal phosphate-dependent protein